MASTIEPPTRELNEPQPRDGRAHRRRPPEAGGRRLHPAGIGILVMLIAAAVATLLSAQGLRKTAQIQPEGIGRDLGLALTRPLVAVSHALFLDRPRQGLKEAIGRGDDDKVDVTIALPPPATGSSPPAESSAAPGATTGGGQTGSSSGETGSASGESGNAPGGAAPGEAEEPAKEAFTPKKKLPIWVAGDSLAITPGQSIVRILPGTKVIKPVGPVDGRVSTGLERPDVFNWFTHIPGEIRRLDPKVVILTFGANDDHDYMTGLPEGTEIDGFGSKSWVKEYRRRVGGLMDLASRDGRLVVWVGIPITRSPDQSRRFQLLNRIYKSEAEKRPGRVVFIDTYELFKDENGAYADYLPNKKGELVQVREPDGVHIRAEGGDWIAREILAALREQYDLTSWKKKQRG